MRDILTLGIALILFAASVFAGVDEDSPKEFKVGFGQVDITPPVGAIITGPRHPVSVGVEDPLFAKTLVVQNGCRTLAIVGLDLVKIRRDLADTAITLAAQRTGIDRDAVMICPSHTHSSPFIPMGGPNNRDYISTLPKLIAGSIEQAYKAMQPARMFLGRSLIYEGHHNRRVISKTDGLALNTWLKKLNDLKQTPQVLGTEGPIDPEMWVARFDALDGQVLGTLVNFACHPALHDRSGLKKFSADFPGVIAEQIAQTYGKQAVCVFTQGPSGNIAPPVQFSPDWRERSAVFARAAVDAAKRAIPIKEPVAVGYTRRDVTVPRCNPEAQHEGAIERLGWRPDSFNTAKRQLANTPKTRNVPVSAGRIGPLGIATNAGELFVEWGLAVKKRSPFPHTIMCELTNEWIGYEPTKKGFQHEGYETLAGVDFVSLEGIQKLVDTAVELLEELWESDAVGYPSRSPDLDVLPGFQNPPPGYGEVPFWWWSGEDLDVDRMICQVRELHKKGISGVQVNYSHHDTPGWLTDQNEPGIFTEEWWKVYSKISEECGKLGMGIGLSTYTIDWPRGAKNLFYHLFYSKPELNAIELQAGKRQGLRGGETTTIACEADLFAARAYQIKNNVLQRGGIDLTSHIKHGRLSWTAPDGQWEIWTFRAVRKPGSFNPLMIGAGETVIRGFFQEFENHNPGKTSKGLNYFFNDELDCGTDKFIWNPDFPQEFRQRKGYDLREVLPAMWVDIGDLTPKVRMDYADVRMSLLEERYFKPIYTWHTVRGMIFGCDNHGRGQQPEAYGDYFRATRWYSAPGHDTPRGHADLIKGKVSSSIANLYRRPRVWLEGYHSLGWGATPERLMFATRENYLYGCTLLNLHGLYYTTYGSHWEWAPPCYHFRMPYWAHMKVFLDYFKRLSYLMSQGNTVCDVAVIYPVAPYEADMNGKAATKTAFELGQKLMASGINFEFIDHDSLARAEVENGRLRVKSAGVSYQALIFPNMDAIRWESIEKAAAFAKTGGKVIVVGTLPSASDRAGRNDAKLAEMNRQVFKADCRFTDATQAESMIRNAFVQDVCGINQTVRALHRKIGPRDVYLVMDAQPGKAVEFRAHGAVELWDPWTGKVRPLKVVQQTATGTQVELPLKQYEAQVVVFTPGKTHKNPPALDQRPMVQKTLPNQWNVSFVPTMDNTYGDFRLPVTPENKQIGVEARRFAWARETGKLAQTAMQPNTDDRSWDKKLHGYGTQFYVLGSVPNDVDVAALDTKLAKLQKVDPSMPIEIDGKSFTWKPYDFSWRRGKEGDLGHQGYHGLKRTVTDDFICLGKPKEGLNETIYTEEGKGNRYYLWTSATVPEDLSAMILVSRDPPADKSHTSPVLTPAAVYVNGSTVNDLTQPVALFAGANSTLIRYDRAGRGHFVMRRKDQPLPAKREPLAMRWYHDPGVIPFDVYAGDRAAEWFRFLSAPGTTAIHVRALGKVEAWLDGKSMANKGNGRFQAAEVPQTSAIVALRVTPQTGRSGGATIPEPVGVETSLGVMPLGDWSKIGILNNYSGGVRYSTIVTLSEKEAKGHVELDLGQVVATAEVHVNGRKVGVCVAPPWHLDVTGYLTKGENTIEVLVYNTLANHYQTIPTPDRYRGKPISGLLGPVRLLSRDWENSD
ncbi:MAG: hypothetical protein JXM70_27525 [Pirellulales bacterium]|nr:hypothetical protein [Pirellulales bacterium]